MAKINIRVKCDSVISNATNSTVRFGKDITETAAKPGEQVKRAAKTIVQIGFSTPDEATVFKVGKEYTITFEG